MSRTLLAAALFVLLTACATKPQITTAEPVPIDPVTEPSVVGALDEAAFQGSVKGAEGAAIGRRVGRVAGLIAAVIGGPEHDTLDQTIDRYRRTRDAAETVGAIIGATDGAMEGAERGYVLDLQFAELHRIPGLRVTRPSPDQIEVRFEREPDAQTLADIATVFRGREQRALDIIASGDIAHEMRDAFIEYGFDAEYIEAESIEHFDAIVLLVRYVD